MRGFRMIVCVSIVCLGFFLLGFVPLAKSAEPLATDSGNRPILLAAQEATIPLTEKTGASEGDECPYKLRLKAGALFLHRQDNDSRILVEDVGGTELINSDSLDLGFAAGMDISLMGQFREFGAELRYFGLHDWSESKSVNTTTEARIFYKSSTFGYLYPALNISADYDSQIHNAEFNLHWWPCANERYHFLMGVRWIRLNEGLDIRLTDGGAAVDRHKITADNRLWGGQLGVEGILFGKPDQGFSVDGSLKAGYYNNNLASRVHEQFFNISASVGKNHGTFAGELGIGAQYAFTRNISLGARYQLLWLDNVALAPDQLRELSTSGGSVDWESLLYQGGWVGLTVSF